MVFSFPGLLKIVQEVPTCAKKCRKLLKCAKKCGKLSLVRLKATKVKTCDYAPAEDCGSVAILPLT